MAVEMRLRLVLLHTRRTIAYVFRPGYDNVSGRVESLRDYTGSVNHVKFHMESVPIYGGGGGWSWWTKARVCWW